MKSDLKPKKTLEELIPTDQNTLTDGVLLAEGLHRGKRGMRDLAPWEAGSILPTNESTTKYEVPDRAMYLASASVYLVWVLSFVTGCIYPQTQNPKPQA